MRRGCKREDKGAEERKKDKVGGTRVRDLVLLEDRKGWASYFDNRLESDHGKLKLPLNPVRSLIHEDGIRNPEWL